MQSKTFLSLCAIIGIATITTLSSFYKPQTQNNDLPPDEIAYKSNTKVTHKNGSLTLSSAFNNDYYTSFNPQGFYYAEIEADQFNREREIDVPMNISVVIDRSGSMAGDKILNAKKAAKYIVDQMDGDDYLSIVTYDGTVELLHQTSSVVNKQLIKNKIDKIYDRGGTNLMGGALKGFDEVQKSYKPGYINRVLLLSDGQANEGITDPREIDRIVRKQNSLNGISISTFGLGNDYNEDLMTSIAESGTGNYYFISHAENIASIFQKELHGLKEVVAQNAKLFITIPEDINIDNVYGFKYEQRGRNLIVDLHDIFSEERKGVLVKYSVRNRINTSLKFVSKIEFSDVAREQRMSINNQNKIEFTNNAVLFNESFNEWVSAQVALYESNERLELAMKEVDKGNYKVAKKMVDENKKYMQSKAPLVSKSVELQRAATVNESYQTKIDDVESMPAEDVKYLQKASKSTNYEIRNKKK